MARITPQAASPSGSYTALGNAWVDVTSAPYGALVDGVTDDTAAWQAAINAVVAAGGGTVYCSKQGVSIINGAQQTGTAQSYSYSGQVLFPANDVANGIISVRIKGPSPAPTMWNSVASAIPAAPLVLRSNATSGSVFDAIPAFTSGGFAFTSLSVTFEDFVLQVPLNPQCNGIKAQTILTFRLMGQNLIAPSTQGFTVKTTTLTGTGVAVWLPQLGNDGVWIGGHLQIEGFPVGIQFSEHLIYSSVHMQWCGVALLADGGTTGHLNCGDRMLLQGCGTYLKAGGTTNPGGAVDMRLDMETSTSGPFTVAAFVSDTGSKLTGRIRRYNQAAPTSGLPHASSGAALQWENIAKVSGPWYNTAPYDTFTRALDIATQLGTADESDHPWTIQNGVWKTNAGVAQYVSGTDAVATCRYRMGSARNAVGGSRLVQAALTTGSTYLCGVTVGRSASSGNYLYVILNGGVVSIRKKVSGTGTVLASSAAATVAASTAYTLNVYCSFSGTPGATQTVTVFIGTTQVVTYNLVAQDITDLADSSTNALKGDRNDGLYASTGDLSTYSRFLVAPLEAA